MGASSADETLKPHLTCCCHFRIAFLIGLQPLSALLSFFVLRSKFRSKSSRDHVPPRRCSEGFLALGHGFCTSCTFSLSLSPPFGDGTMDYIFIVAKLPG